MKECTGCGFATKRLRHFPINRTTGNDQDLWLCRVCASSPSGRTASYPGLRCDLSNSDVAQTIAVACNLILEAIERRDVK